MCTFVGRGILAAWANNAQCIGVETGHDQKDCLHTGRAGATLVYLVNKQARNLKSDNLSFDVHPRASRKVTLTFRSKYEDRIVVHTY